MITLPDFPDFAAEEKELFKLNSVMTSLVSYENQIRETGMSRAIGVGLESASPGILGGLNVNMLTELGSTTKLSVGLEAIEWRKIALAVSGTSIIVGLLIKLYQWLKDRWGGSGGGSSSAIAAKQRQVDNLKRDMEDVKKEIQARLKKHAETPISEQAFMNIFPDEDTPFNLPYKLNLIEHIRSKKINTNQAIIAMARITTISRHYNLYDPAQIGSLILYQATKDLTKPVDLSWVVFCDELRYWPAFFGKEGYNRGARMETIFNGITMHYVQGMMSATTMMTEEFSRLMKMNNARMNSKEPITEHERDEFHAYTTNMLERVHALINDAGFMADNKVFGTLYKNSAPSPTIINRKHQRYLPPAIILTEYIKLFPAIVKELSLGLSVYNPRAENRENEEEWISLLNIRLTPLKHILSRFDLDDVITNHRAVFSSSTDKAVTAQADEILSRLKDMKKELDTVEASLQSGKEMLFSGVEGARKYKLKNHVLDIDGENIDHLYMINGWIRYISDVSKALQLYYSTGTRAELGLFRLQELMKKHK